mgnify:CR=1 FL=1
MTDTKELNKIIKLIPKLMQNKKAKDMVAKAGIDKDDVGGPSYPNVKKGVKTSKQAKGSVLIHQKMFESRLFFVDKLIDMGAKIILCDPHRANVIGHNFKSNLKATTMVSPDIRAGISLLIAALSANGISIIQNIEQIDRGYENIDIRLNRLGAKIKRI